MNRLQVNDVIVCVNTNKLTKEFSEFLTQGLLIVTWADDVYGDGQHVKVEPFPKRKDGFNLVYDCVYLSKRFQKMSEADTNLASEIVSIYTMGYRQ